MPRTVVLNVVGLTPGLLGPDSPALTRWAEGGRVVPVRPPLPAVTCSVQSTFLTGERPSAHGVVGNGWYFRDEREVKFWRQSNGLVQAPTLWDWASGRGLTCANLFWWYAMYSPASVTVTPRPMYPADGRKLPDVWTHPPDLRRRLQEDLGQFPLFEFWGPNTTVRSTEWIARAARAVERERSPDLAFVYLPHLDYALQRSGPGSPEAAESVREVDRVAGDLIAFYEDRGVRVVVLSEYGITPARRAVSLNRVLREHGLLTLREELGRELLDAGASRAFAVADHQVAHVYFNEGARSEEVRQIVAAVPGVERVLGEAEKRAAGLDHPRAGDLVAVAEPDAWFTYYYWADDARAPDFARTVDIHRKPGYDPVELFLDPGLRFPKARVARRLAQKKLGFRTLLDVIPLDPSLVGGTHGRLPERPADGPLLITRHEAALAEAVGADGVLDATAVRDVIRTHVD